MSGPPSAAGTGSTLAAKKAPTSPTLRIAILIASFRFTFIVLISWSWILSHCWVRLLTPYFQSRPTNGTRFNRASNY